MEPENGGGELTIKLPKESQKFISERKTFRVSIEFSLEHPKGGIQFVLPGGNGSIEEVLYELKFIKYHRFITKPV